MKKYIIITYDIHPIGGTQAYTAGKARYLEKSGWDVIVFFAGKKTGNCYIAYLNKFLSGGRERLNILPCNMFETERIALVDDLLTTNGIYDEKDSIIIESHYDVAAFWGEILAEKLGCKHYIFCCNEYYRNKNGYRTFYKQNLDFFYFKFCRNELIAYQGSVKRLFNGYKGIYEPRIKYPELIVEQDPVQNVPFDNLDLLPRSEWNICIISRMDKPFVQEAIEGIKKFSEIHSQLSINLIFIGDEDPIQVYLHELFNDADNVNIVCWGVLVPIPRVIFNKIDVVIAAAQTARLISYEDVYVITANVMSKMTPGVLGYDTQDSWYGGGLTDRKYEDVLEDVLVNGKYKDIVFNMPEHRPADYYYDNQWKYLELSEPEKKYYTHTLKKYRKKDWVALFPFGKIEKKSKIIIFGAGAIGQDYISQLELSQYCELIAVIDNNYDEFDSTVLEPECTLKNMEYDVVVIAVKSNEWAKQMIDDVKKITQGKRIIHDIKFLWTY